MPGSYRAGISSLVCWVFSGWLTFRKPWVLVMKEKEQGVLDPWRTTAARPWEILFGRTLTYVMMFLPTACIAPLVAGQLVYGVPMRGSMFNLLLGHRCFSSAPYRSVHCSQSSAVRCDR